MNESERLTLLYAEGNKLKQENNRKRIDAHPIEPNTGKPGDFLEFRGTHPMYRTEDGIVFEPSADQKMSDEN